YGIYTIALARPVFQSFEIDRFRVVTAVDIESDQLAQAPAELRSLPWAGPRTIAAVKPTDPAERLKSIELGLAGRDLSMLPANWRPYESQRDVAWKAARPTSVLLARYPGVQTELANIARTEGKDAADLRFLPLVSRQVSWVVILAPPDAHIAGYLPIDGFF
ncbi:MAG: fimb protein, partial [Pseudomonadota bacterium]|nr:fimb protein [Pseudomonadota bacterium]